MFSAWVYSSAQYCRVLKAPIPVTEMHDHDAEPGADRAPVAHQMFPRERQDDQERQRPAQERQRHRRNMSGGEAADDGVAGPAQRGDAEQQIGLVGDPADRESACSGWDRKRTCGWSFSARFKDAAARPAFGAGPEIVARPCSQTRIFAAHQWGGCIATMRRRPARCAARRPGAGCEQAAAPDRPCAAAAIDFQGISMGWGRFNGACKAPFLLASIARILYPVGCLACERPRP